MAESQVIAFTLLYTKIQIRYKYSTDGQKIPVGI
jgi:hypothetical protein